MAQVYDFLIYFLSVFMIAATFSILWKDNEFFRWTQFTYVAIAAANYAVLGWDHILNVVLIPLSQGELIQIIPLILSILIFTTISTKYNWIAKYSTSFILGVSVAIMMRGTIDSDITAQIATIFNFAKMGATPFKTFNNIVTIVCAVATLSYFFFHFVHKTNVGRGTQKLGRYVIMLAFGTQFGTRIQYIALFIAWIVGYVTTSGPPSGYRWIQIPVILITSGMMLFAIRREK